MTRDQHWIAREHELLRLALRRLQRARPLCEDCGSRAATLVYSATGATWVVRVRHERSCPVLRSPHSRNACNGYIRGWLVALGTFQADYGEPPAEHVPSR